MVHLISRFTENSLLLFDSSNFFFFFLVRHTPFHFIKVSLPAPCSRPCTSPKSIFTWTSSCAGQAHMESWAPGASGAVPHPNRSGQFHVPGAKKLHSSSGKNKGGHLERKSYFYRKWKTKRFSVIRKMTGWALFGTKFADAFP